MVYGDYDADGVTSTTILVKTLQTLGAEVGWYIPNRFSEGYGPNELAFRNAYDEGVSLIITVDNGIQGHKEIEMVQKLGVDVIVTIIMKLDILCLKRMPSYIQCIQSMNTHFTFYVVLV